ncbi:hypothetical protein GW17_00049711 [Ensete ventricosum]|nr:hypothetical protein GW17_00049711 [Ensete ventricosum]
MRSGSRSSQRAAPSRHPRRPSAFIACRCGRNESIGTETASSNSLRRKHYLTEVGHISVFSTGELESMRAIVLALGPILPGERWV